MLDNRESAINLGEMAVAEGMAACAQIEGPVTSIYSWKGEVKKEDEMRIVFKASRAIAMAASRAKAASRARAAPSARKVRAASRASAASKARTASCQPLPWPGLLPGPD